MDYFSGPLTLYTSDKIRLIDFFSDVFEFEVDTELDLIVGGDYQLKIEELIKEPASESEKCPVTFSFECKSVLELQEIINKYNFFQYRNMQKSSKSEKLSVENWQISIHDIDGREWRFKARVTH